MSVAPGSQEPGEGGLTLKTLSSPGNTHGIDKAAKSAPPCAAGQARLALRLRDLRQLCAARSKPAKPSKLRYAGCERGAGEAATTEPPRPVQSDTENNVPWSYMPPLAVVPKSVPSTSSRLATGLAPSFGAPLKL